MAIVTASRVAVPALSAGPSRRAGYHQRGAAKSVCTIGGAHRLRAGPVRAKIISDESFEETVTAQMEQEANMMLTRESFDEGIKAAETGNKRRPILLPDSIEDLEGMEKYLEGATCKVFIDRNGEFREALCCDYGFRKGTQRMYEEGVDGQIPDGAFQLGWENFKREFTALRQSFRYDDYKKIRSKAPLPGVLHEVEKVVGGAIVGGIAKLDTMLEEAGAPLFSKLPRDPQEVMEEALTPSCKQFRARLDDAVLSNAAVWKREEKRDEIRGPDFTPPYVRVIYLGLCYFLDFYFDNRPIQRFWFLESVARMPYFSYITMLHLYESLGWWRAGAKLRKVHFAEEWNELHHLMIMESLGGDRFWLDRFMAGHASVAYYIILCGLFFFNPKLAYNFSELIEGHAVDTYGEFADANEELLKSMPPPFVALNYYTGSNLYLFDYFQTYYTAKNEMRRPKCETLHDVFCNIRDDEGQHVETMAACQDQRIVKDFVTIEESVTY